MTTFPALVHDGIPTTRVSRSGLTDEVVEADMKRNLHPRLPVT